MGPGETPRTETVLGGDSRPRDGGTVGEVDSSGARDQSIVLLGREGGPSGAGKADASPTAAGLPPGPDGRAVLGQMLAHLDRLALARGSRLRVQLRPESLGSLDLRLALQDGKLVLDIRVESGATRSLVENHAAELRQALADRGVDLRSLSVGGLGSPPSADWLGGLPAEHQARQGFSRGASSDRRIPPVEGALGEVPPPAAETGIVPGSSASMVDYRI